MASEMDFVVRALPTTGLDGAFRIHVLPEHLEQLKLKIGDVCAITNESVERETVGFGIAWRAAEKMGNAAKSRPVKITPTAMGAYGIKEGNQVKLSKTEVQVSHADKVVLTEVTPTGNDQVYADGSENRNWYWTCGHALSNSEAFARGMTFDVSGKKGIRKRFCIMGVQSSSVQPGAANLFYFDGNTELALTDEASIPISDVAAYAEKPLSPEYIGGLHDQLDTLNRRIRRAVQEIKHSSWPNGFRQNKGILIHGFEGTGKSLLLKRLGHAGFRKVACLTKSSLTGGGVTKNQEIIKSIFKEARAGQPSLVLIDNIDKLATVQDDIYGETVANELEKLRECRVLVVATSRSPTDVNSALFGPGRLSALIELPIPDREAREQILRIVLENYALREGVIPIVISQRTHGFTGKDLASLVEVAGDVALERYDLHDSLADDAANGTPKTPIDDSQEEKPINGDISMPKLTVQDFEAALAKVRPTALREIIFEPPNVKWDDIGGAQDIQKRFDKIIEWPLYHAQLMAEWRVRPKKGVLLYGPPGCSKTLTAQAVATKYGLNFIAVKGAELISMYVGESERAVREIFRKARAAAPCIIFFDEIDAIASERDSPGSKSLNVVTTLLNEMDGFDSLKNVFVLAATNKPEALDPAIMRPGRFDSYFYLGPPNAAARAEIFAIETKGLPIQDVDFEKLVAATEGYTGAEIVQICNLAKDMGIDRKIESSMENKVGMGEFEKALAQTGNTVTAEMLANYQAFAEVYSR